jgi:NADH-quinone oxidoreductase subunit N
VQAGLYPLAVIGFLTSVVAAFYYLRIIKIIYFDEPAPAFDQAGPVLNFVVLVTTLAVLLFAFWPAPLLLAVSAAAKSLF